MTTTIPFHELTAEDVMRRDLVTVPKTARLSELTELLADHQVGGVPVTDHAGHIAGVVSMRDVIAYFAAKSDEGDDGRAVIAADPLDDEEFIELALPKGAPETVVDVMTGQVHSVSQTEKLPAIARRMVELGVHRILVTDDDLRHVGLVSSFDVLRAIAD